MLHHLFLFEWKFYGRKISFYAMLLSFLAFGILVPMMGLGMNGLWASVHGKFSPRITPQTEAMPQESAETRQDKDHD